MPTKKENAVISAQQNETTPQNLIAIAIEKGAGVEQLEKLMELQLKWQANEARKDFMRAMSDFQSSVPVIEKKKLVAFGNTKYKYAELGEIFQTIQGTLSHCGLSYRWELEEDGGKIKCTCIISHVNGHSERTTMTANKDASGGKNDIQAHGSATTYLQRYSLIAALGLTTAQEDNDGQTAGTGQKMQPQAEPETLSPEIAAAISSCMTEEELIELWKSNKALQKKAYFKDALAARKQVLSPEQPAP